jgi:hypothetical protein
MTPAPSPRPWEPEFIRLWQAGATQAQIAQALGIPIGTPRHTVKKTYVVEQLYVDLIERYARTEGLELKDVVNLALHAFFERRHYLPEEAS